MPGTGQADASVTTLGAGAITATSIAADAIGASELAANAIGTSEFASAVDARIVDAAWDEATSGHTTAGSFGYERVHTTRMTETLTGAAAHGEFANPTITLFTVTGEILIVALVPYCTTGLTSAGGGTLALGIVGSTAAFIAATTATDIDTDEFWVDATPDAFGVALPAALKDFPTTSNIVGTVGTADITVGVIDFTLYWLPLSTDAAVA